jgi:hypothetical protein
MLRGEIGTSEDAVSNERGMSSGSDPRCGNVGEEPPAGAAIPGKRKDVVGESSRPEAWLRASRREAWRVQAVLTLRGKIWTSGKELGSCDAKLRGSSNFMRLFS